MKLTEINPGMVLSHISDVNECPQKLIVVMISEVENPREDSDSVYCEWISRDGIIQRKWLCPLWLKKW